MLDTLPPPGGTIGAQEVVRVNESIRSYGASELARLRKSRGLTQKAAASAMGLKQKNTLGLVETGERQASPRIMQGIAEAYVVSKREALRLCNEAFEHGRSLSRHRRRQLKLMAS